MNRPALDLAAGGLARSLFLLMTLAVVPAGAQGPPALGTEENPISGQVQVILRARLPASGASPRLALDGRAFRAARDLPCFYQRRSFAPAWSAAGQILPVVEQLLGALGAAEDHGLRAEDYHLGALRLLAAALRVRPDAGGLAELDLLLSDAFLAYGSALRNGRINPNATYADCALGRETTDLPTLLEESLGAQRIEAALAGLAPPLRVYERMQEALGRYRRLAQRPGREPVPPGPTLRLGDQGERITALRARLADAAEADAAEGLPATEVPELFDEPLAEALRRFQERHGLEADGAAGKATLRELNLGVEDHIRQIEVNLERWRWLPHDLGRRYVLVNIAAFHLEAVENGESALQMRVIVGKPFTRTPMFSSGMESVLLNPSWYVPAKIAREEIFPKAAKDPTYLRREDFEILPGSRLRQRPGPKNALGKIKFVFPNRFGVYLHDTPAPGLFVRTVRTFSHGCIRIEKPFDLAVWVLGGDPRWTPEAIRAGIDTGRERVVPIPEAVAVHVGYWTAWVGEDGMLRLGRDVYQRDAQLARMLQAGRPAG